MTEVSIPTTIRVARLGIRLGAAKYKEIIYWLLLVSRQTSNTFVVETISVFSPLNLSVWNVEALIFTRRLEDEISPE